MRRNVSPTLASRSWRAVRKNSRSSFAKTYRSGSRWYARAGFAESEEIVMTMRIGYLLPTREAVMEGRPEAEPLLALGERAETLGYDSVWVGDSLLARPRHEPITLLAGVAGRTKHVKLGTA